MSAKAKTYKASMEQYAAMWKRRALDLERDRDDWRDQARNLLKELTRRPTDLSSEINEVLLWHQVPEIKRRLVLLLLEVDPPVPRAEADQTELDVNHKANVIPFPVP